MASKKSLLIILAQAAATRKSLVAKIRPIIDMASTKSVLIILALAAAIFASVAASELKLIGQSGAKEFYTTTEPQLFHWAEAVQFCREHNMTLATAEDRNENGAIQLFVNKTGITGPNYWMGGTDLFNSTLPAYNYEYNFDNWSWLTPGNPKLNVHYWLKGHPHISSGKHCMFTTRTVTTVVHTGLGTIYIYSNWGASDCVTDTNEILCQKVL
jgi:hypothetical protein